MTHSPHSTHRALFWTQAKPCEEALPLLADAYNRLAGEIEEEWEKNQRLEEQFDALERAARAVKHWYWDNDASFVDLSEDDRRSADDAIAMLAQALGESVPAKRPTVCSYCGKEDAIAMSLSGPICNTCSYKPENLAQNQERDPAKRPT